MHRHAPVKTGVQVHDLMLDDILAGTCHLSPTGIGDEVTLKPDPGEAPARFRVTSDIAGQEDAGAAAEAIVRCALSAAGENGMKRLMWAGGDRREKFIAGPLALQGAALKLDFRLKDAAGR